MLRATHETDDLLKWSDCYNDSVRFLDEPHHADQSFPCVLAFLACGFDCRAERGGAAPVAGRAQPTSVHLLPVPVLPEPFTTELRLL